MLCRSLKLIKDLHGAGFGNLDLDGLGDWLQAEVRAGSLLDLVFPEGGDIGFLDAMYLNVLDDLLGDFAWVSADWHWANGEADFIVLGLFDVLSLLFAAGGGAFMTSLAVALLFLTLAMDIVVADNVGVQSFLGQALSFLGLLLPFLGWSLGGFVDDGISGSELTWIFEDTFLGSHEVGFFLSVEGTAQSINISAEFVVGGGQLGAFSVVDDVEVVVDFNLDFTVGQSVNLDETLLDVEAVFIIKLGWFLVDENLSLMFRVGLNGDHVDFPVVLLVVHNNLDVLLVVAGFAYQHDVVVVRFAEETRLLAVVSLLLLLLLDVGVGNIMHHNVPSFTEMDWVGGVIESVGGGLINNASCCKRNQSN